MMKKELIKKYLNTKELGNCLELFDKIPYSTNTRVAELIDAGKQDILVVADVQEGGRGRIGRTWYSGACGESIAMSFSCAPSMDTSKLPFITPLVALAVTDVFENDSLKIKWPNDIVVEGKKVCGILCELKQHADVNHIIIGIGVNVFQKDFSKELSHAASSLLHEKIVEYTDAQEGIREKIIASIINAFEKRLLAFLKDGFGPMQKEYNNKLYGIGSKAKILDSSVSGGDITGATVVAEGTFAGSDEYGMALIETEDGIKTILSGELSLRIE